MVSSILSRHALSSSVFWGRASAFSIVYFAMISLRGRSFLSTAMVDSEFSQHRSEFFRTVEVSVKRFERFPEISMHRKPYLCIAIFAAH